MKLLITTVLVTLFLQTAYAQGISAGVRTGIGNTLDIKDIKAGSIDRTWDKQLFVRYETKNRLAFEVGVTHYNYSNTIEPIIFDCVWGVDGDIYEPMGSMTNYSLYDIILSAQYEITPNFLKENCRLLKNFKSYIGLNIGAAYGSAVIKGSSRNMSTDVVTTTEEKSNGFDNAQIGLSHTLIYSLGRVYFTSVGSYNVQPTNTDTFYLNGGLFPNSKLSLRIGLGYTF